jgi:sugar fermentation stimulation protein A
MQMDTHHTSKNRNSRRVQIPLAAGAPLAEATFTNRLNQFVIEAEFEGSTIQAYMSDRGRLIGLLTPGARLLLAHAPASHNREFQAVAVYTGDELVSLDTHLPNRLLVAALEARALPQFARYPEMQPEVRHGAHRFDFRLRGEAMHCWLEVKSVGQIINGLASFPDAPTERGRQHIEALTTLAQQGQRTAVVFIVQRDSGRAVVPNAEIDPLFARAMRHAMTHGVEFYAYRCPLTPEGIQLGSEIPVFASAAAVPAHV